MSHEFLQKYLLLRDTQFGFRNKQFCETALITLAERKFNSIYEADYCGMLQLDLNKAFDLVNYSLLLPKCKLCRCNAATGFSHTYRTDHKRSTLDRDFLNLRWSALGFLRDPFLGQLCFDIAMATDRETLLMVQFLRLIGRDEICQSQLVIRNSSLFSPPGAENSTA